MKRILAALGMVFILSLSTSLGCLAAEQVGSDTLADWDIKVPSYANTLSVLDGEDGNYYIYPMGEQGIPYVMIRAYEGFSSEDEFFTWFTEGTMMDSYPDLQILTDMEQITIDGDDYYEVDYIYSVSGYTCVDRRIVRIIGDHTYMFASKEIPALDLFVDTLLEETIADCEFLALDEAVPVPEPEDPAPVPTDTSEIPEFLWTEQMEKDLQEEGFMGSFYIFDEIAAKVWIPDCMTSADLTQEDKDFGYIGYFATDDFSWQIGVTYMQLNMTQDEYLQFLQSFEDADSIRQLVINHIPFILYALPDSDVMALATVTSSGYVMEFSFYPAGDEEFLEYLDIIGMSIQPE